MTSAPPPACPTTQALAAGNVAAYAALYDRLSGPMLRVARALTGSVADAEDAVHDVFVSLAKYRHQLGNVRDLDAYIFSSLRHAVAANKSRRRIETRRLRLAAVGMSPTTEARDGAAAADLGAEDLAALVARLPPKQREVIALKIDAGLTFEQIGSVLGVSPNTAASRYRYALEKLRQQMQEPK